MRAENLEREGKDWVGSLVLEAIPYSNSNFEFRSWTVRSELECRWSLFHIRARTNRMVDIQTQNLRYFSESEFSLVGLWLDEEKKRTQSMGLGPMDR